MEKLICFGMGSILDTISSRFPMFMQWREPVGPRSSTVASEGLFVLIIKGVGMGDLQGGHSKQPPFYKCLCVSCVISVIDLSSN